MKCSECGGPVRANNKIGICKKTEACRKAARKIHDARYYREVTKPGLKRVPRPKKEKVPKPPRALRPPCALCGQELGPTNRFGICSRKSSPECARTYMYLFQQTPESREYRHHYYKNRRDNEPGYKEAQKKKNNEFYVNVYYPKLRILKAAGFGPDNPFPKHLFSESR